MKNLLCAALLAVLVPIFAHAQNSFVLSAPPTVIAPPEVIDTTADGHVQNMTSTNLNLKWERIIIQVPAGMHTQVCDNFKCWFPQVNSHTFDLDPFENGEMIVHFLNDIQQPMDAIVHIKVTNLNDTTETQTGVFAYSSTISSTASPVAASVKLFPNPATEYFSLENADAVAAIRVFSLDGRQVNYFNVSAANTYSLAGQVAGTYILGLEDKNGHLVQAVELQKQ